MNKHSYKIIFSKVRQQLIVVADIASSHTSSKDNSIKNAKAVKLINTASFIAKIKPLTFTLLTFLGMVFINNAYANNSTIIADPAANRNNQANILQTANGLPQVDIQTPNNKGLSHNKYSQFDVGNLGAIINNSGRNSTTQIGGWVQANPNLAAGREAQIILNEINNTRASNLNGFIEIAGRKSDIIIANPSGINVDGAGFINANRATLTTGNPEIKHGDLTGFNVTQGQIAVTGKGLNNSSSDYTDIIAQSTKINAQIFSNKEINLITGDNKVTRTADITSTSSTTNDNKPQYAIDVAELGGMYAGKIKLVASEHGVGVKNAGQIFASVDEIVLTANGEIVNTGSIVAQNKQQPSQAKLKIKADKLIDTGRISSQGQQQITSKDLSNQGLIVTSNELKIDNQNKLDNSKGNIKAARLEITTKTIDNTAGKILQTGSQGLELNINQVENTAKGIIGNKLTDNVDENVTIPNNPIDNNLDINSNANHIPSSAQADNKVNLNETQATIFNSGMINVSDRLINSGGSLLANGRVDLAIANGLNNDDSTINLNNLAVFGALFSNQQGNIVTNNLDAKVDNVANQDGSLTSLEHLNLYVTDFIDNKQGNIQAQSVKINAQSLDSSEATLKATDNILIDATDAITNQQGQIEATTVEIATKQLNGKAGQINAVKQLNINALDKLDNSEGQILAQEVVLNTKDLISDSGGIKAVNDLTINATNQLSSRQGEILANNIKLDTDSLDNTKGSIKSGNELSINANTKFDNNSGELVAANTIINTQKLISDNGSIKAINDLTINATNQLSSKQGEILANNIKLYTISLDNSKGSIGMATLFSTKI